MTLREKAEAAAWAVLDHAKDTNNAIDKADIADAIERVAREFAEKALQHAMRFQIAQIEDEEPIPSRRRDLVSEAITEAEKKL